MKILELFDEPAPPAPSDVEHQVVLAPSERLAKALADDFDARQLRRRARVWEAAPVRSWDGWLDALWREWGVWAPGATLMHPEQEALLWEKVVAESPIGATLLSPRSAARRARQTRATMLAYGAPLTLDPAMLNEDQLAFQGWHTRYREVCQSANMFDRASLPDRLLASDVPWPTSIRLAAFDQTTPQQRALFGTLQARGCAITQEAPVAVAARAARTTFPSSDDELWTAVNWLAERNGRNPKLALVLPDASAVRSRLERVFLDVLGTPCALAQPLGQYPIVRSALRVLALLAPRVGFEDLSSLLRSPFVGDFGVDRNQRALLELRLRRLHIPSQPLGGYLQQLGDELAPVFTARLGRVASMQRSQAQRPSTWARLFDDALRALGWPGTRKLDAAEQQIVERFRQRLYDLQALDFFAGEIAVGEALARLEGWLSDTQFAPNLRPRPAVAVMGPVEAAGQQFDAIWVAGLDDSVWPASAKPDPYLPLALQRKLGLPHCSAENELAFATRVTQRLRQAARAAVFSSPLAAGAQPLRISRLVASLPEHRFEAPSAQTRSRRLFGERPALESWSDENGPPLDTLKARGGSRIFQLQAACPFQAFAVLRLKADRLDTVAHGLTAGERGNLVHGVMEQVWKRLRSSAELAAVGSEELERLAAEASLRALAWNARLRPDVLQGRFFELEKQRLTRLALDWLEIERARELPFEILATERKQRIELACLKFDVIVDRIDRVAGRNLVLDYKTGSVSTMSWDGDRPDQPQLPLYVATASEPVHGVAFANLKRPRLRFYGSCEDGKMLPGAQTISDFAAQRNDWTEVLTRLASEHLAGHAAIDPKNRTTCQLCHLAGLCRVGQR